MSAKKSPFCFESENCLQKKSCVNVLLANTKFMVNMRNGILLPKLFRPTVRKIVLAI